MSSPQSNTYHPTYKKTKAKNWFYHDADARHDLKIKRLRRLGGWEYYGLYFALVEILREQESYRIDEEIMPDVGFDLGLDDSEFRKFIETCVDCDLLTYKDGFYFSPSLVDRMAEYDEKCAKNREIALEREAKKHTDEPRSPTPAPLAPVTPIIPTSGATNVLPERGVSSHVRATNVALGVPIPFPIPIPNSNSEDLKKGHAPPKRPDPPPDPPDEYTAAALEHLDTPDERLGFEKPWQNTNPYMLAGRRPLLSSSEILFEPTELANVFRQLEELGLGPDAFQNGVAKAEAKMNEMRARGETVKPDRIPGWFMGWIKRDLKDDSNKAKDGKIKDNILEKTRAVR